MQHWPVIFIAILFSSINCHVKDSTVQDGSSEDVMETFEASASFRLPRKILPKEYFIKILPNEMGKLSFDGRIKISLWVIEPTSEIFLNQGFDLALGDETIKVIRNNSKAQEDASILDVIYRVAPQIVSYKVDKELNVGDTVVFSATFSGLFVSNTQGLNHLEYVDTDGIKKRVLSTYFQPAGARQVFPCLDEPDLKAKFTLQVARREGETILSNMIVNHTIPDEGNSITWVEFQQSVPMSTYLLAFVVCDFDQVRRRVGRQKLVRVWARREALRQSSYAADLAADVLGWYEGYTGIEFPLQKLDLVSLTAYPVSGMENFGLIIAQEVCSTSKEKLTGTMWVSTVVAHEVAHQWAGNLVTPMWWSEFWLSEGIATFLAALALDELRPFLQAMNHLTVETVSLVKRNDISDEGSTLLQPQFNPLTNQLRDVYIYYKGAAILKMIESMIGGENFKKGLRGYFSKYKYLSVTQNDFFNVMEQALDRTSSLPEPLHMMMKNWTEAKGYPVVTVQRNSNNQLSVKQIPFKKHNNIVKEATLTQPEEKTLWWVPVSLATSSNPDFFNKTTKLWIPPSREEVSLKDYIDDNDTWIVLNVQQSAYVRVNYDSQTWKAISKQLYADHEVIHMLNRAQLIDDAFQLFHKGHVMAHVPFELISYLSKERSYFAFKSLFDNLKKIELLLRGGPEYPLLRKYILSLISPLISANLGDDNVNRKLKNYILSWACVMRHEQCTKLAQNQFQEWKKTNDNSVFTEFASESFLCAAVECGNVSDWDIVYSRYLSALNSTSDIKEHLVNALSCTKNTTVILRYFQLIENTSNELTVTEARDIFNSLVRSHNWADLTWMHLISNMKRIRKRFGADPVPFVTSIRDLNYLKLIIEAELKNEHLTKYYKNFLKENEDSVTASTIIIQEVSKWLKSAMTP